MTLAVVQEVQCGVFYLSCCAVRVCFYTDIVEVPLAVRPLVRSGLGQEDSCSACLVFVLRMYFDPVAQDLLHQATGP